MRRTTRKNKNRKSEDPKPASLVSVVTHEGKTTVRQFDGRRFVRFGEVRGKRVAWIEFFTAQGDGHYLTVRFQDQTVLNFEITPLFTVKPEYYDVKSGEIRTIKKWPEMRSER